ncbi:DUF2501 domain-containing protein [Acetobacter fallax]|uniref:DUF2501 domain-containing protein n=1 Tax=Acetobacter fallax TaxID=1737473 RepID=A0ABX0KA84_9PROT|nr:DUF2501 domain-containing protein [Acetobacter fallax]NHO32870.1 DUF2501 domain-containing protein [Acetobacter fallax]NHO36432.1 DUF2501 domain-containing protein [Acetobacter fallax]
MFGSRQLALLATCGLVLSSAGVAYAQTSQQLPAGTTLSAPPPGSIPVTNPADAASAPSQGAQMVHGVTGAATSATPGALNEGGMPSIDSASPGNVAGLLSYCIHKKYVYGTTPRSVARGLAKRQDVKNDQAYSLGGQGLLQNGSSTPFDISTLNKSQRVKLCSDLTKKGQTLN